MYHLPVTASGASLAYLDLGDRTGPATLHLGGLGSAGTVGFAPVIAAPALHGTGRHLLVDLIGSGWSDHDDRFAHSIDEHAGTVATMLDALRLREVAVVGHSLGGSVAISLAAQRPDLVGRLVVAEPNLDPGVGTFSATIAAQDEDEFAERGHAGIVAELLRHGERGDVVAAQFARTLRRWSSRGLHRTAVSLLADRPATFRAQLSSFAGPREYISGALSREDLGPLRAAGCRVNVVPAAGHVLMWDNLPGFAAAVAAALRAESGVR
ncbi:alpha/beta fold hydrolase [Dactylosporangium cerinum]|uniref:Alpha/beta fold hydrolase n=1 Tax=Dactylosporangium cerinum TaxID=1434730 RepID=A0ABV9W4U4_9ACTN